MRSQSTGIAHVINNDGRGRALCGARLWGTTRLGIPLAAYGELRRWWKRQGWAALDSDGYPEAVPGICEYCDGRALAAVQAREGAFSF
jgi:hypothetical protein